MRETAVATKPLKIFWLTVFFISPAVPLLLYFHRNWYTFFHSWSLAMVAGIVAFVWINNQFILAARTRYFDRIFGLDRILRFHGNMGVIIAVLIVVHVALKSIYQFERNLQVILGVVATQIFLAVIVVSVVLFSSTFLLRLRPLERLRRYSAEKLRLQYQHLRAFHNLTILAGALVAAHVVLASSTAETRLRQVVMLAWFLVALVMYGEHKILRPARLRKRPFTVSRVVEEGPGVQTIHLTIPDGVEWRARAGQFAFFAHLPGREEHPFTLSSPEETGEISFTAKDLGDWSGNLGHVSPGDSFAVDGPYGVFTLRRAVPGRPVVMLAGGIGITPFLGMLRTMARRSRSVEMSGEPQEDREDRHAASGSPRTVDLVWNVRWARDLFCRDELDRISAAVPGMRWSSLVSREQEGSFVQGRMDADWLSQWLRDHPDFAEREYYLCGPAAQMETLIRTLRGAGVPAVQIHFENFAM